MDSDRTHPPSLSDFIIAAIEEACPTVDGEKIYMRGFERFTEYCAAQQRKLVGLPERRRISRLTLKRE